MKGRNLLTALSQQLQKFTQYSRQRLTLGGCLRDGDHHRPDLSICYWVFGVLSLSPAEWLREVAQRFPPAFWVRNHFQGFESRTLGTRLPPHWSVLELTTVVESANDHDQDYCARELRDESNMPESVHRRYGQIIHLFEAFLVAALVSSYLGLTIV